MIRTRRFALDLSAPLRTARGEIAEREGFLVAVERDGDGGEAGGLGEATPLPGWTESLSACEATLAEERADGDGSARDRIDARESPAARHGVALALDDAAARDRGRSLGAHLADRAGLPTPASSVPVNATVGDGSRAETVAAAGRAASEGYECLKVKIGARPLEEDVARLRAVRDAVGDDVALRADANGAWDRETAREALDRFEPLGLAYVEQPLPATDLAGAAALRAETTVPVALDESLAEHALDRVLAANAADALVLKPMALGGPDRALDAAVRARAAGVEPVVTTTVDAVVARTAAVHVASAVPDVSACGLATGDLLAEDLARDPCPISDGRVSVPDGPGLAGGAFDGLI